MHVAEWWKTYPTSKLWLAGLESGFVRCFPGIGSLRMR